MAFKSIVQNVGKMLGKLRVVSPRRHLESLPATPEQRQARRTGSTRGYFGF